MVYNRVSIDMKQRALQLLQCRWEVDAVVEALGVSKRSINRWVNNLEHEGSVKAPLSFQGRLRILRADIIADLVNLVHQNPTLYLDEIAEWLALVHDQPIPRSTLQRTLSSMNLTYKQLQRTAAERDEVARVNWHGTMQRHYTAEQMVFTDESSIDNRNFHRKRGCAVSGKRAVQQYPQKRGQRYSLIPALSLDGYLAVRVVSGSVNGVEFYDFIVNDIVSTGPLSS